MKPSLTRRGFAGALAGGLQAQTTTRLTISVASTGGSQYVIGGAIAELINKHVPGVSATVEVMGSGSIADSLKLLDNGRISMLINNVDLPAEALEGRLRGYPRRIAVRNLVLLTTQYCHLVSRDLTTLADLRGKIVSTGPPAGSTEVQAARLLAVIGLTPRDLRRQDRLSLNEATGALKDRKIDAFFWVGGPVPLPAVTDLAATSGVTMRLIGHAREADAVARSHGVYFVGAIPKGTYRGVNVDVPVLCNRSALMAHERMDSRLAYQIAKLMVERTRDLAAAHKGLASVSLKSASTGSPIPFHEGAARYYREQGVL